MTSSPSLPAHYTFVVTEALGAKIYGSCLLFHERLEPKELVTVERTEVSVPLAPVWVWARASGTKNTLGPSISKRLATESLNDIDYY